MEALYASGKWIDRTNIDEINKLVFDKDYNDYWYGRLFFTNVNFVFKNNKKFEMKTLEGEIKHGSYKHEVLKAADGGKYTHISMDFDDGTKGEGSMRSYLLSGGTSGTISIDNIYYHIFPGADSGDRSHWQDMIDNEKVVLKDFLASGFDRAPIVVDSINGPIDMYLCKGKIIEEDGDYYFLDSYDTAKAKLEDFPERYSFYNLNSNGEFSAIPMSLNKPVILKRYAPITNMILITCIYVLP